MNIFGDKKIETSNKYATWLFARAIRLGTVQVFYNKRELTLDEAKELLQGNLDPDDSSTKYDDSEHLEIHN